MQCIGFIVLPGFQMLSVSSLSVFELANWEIGEPAYDVHLLSETGGSIRSSAGISVATEPFDDRNFDTLMVGGSVVAGALTPGVIKFLRQGVERSRRVASTCIGASCWPKPVCWMAVARPRIGTARENCRFGSKSEGGGKIAFS